MTLNHSSHVWNYTSSGVCFGHRICNSFFTKVVEFFSCLFWQWGCQSGDSPLRRIIFSFSFSRKILIIIWLLLNLMLCLQCNFYFHLWQGCRNGDSCFFSHDLGPSVSSSSTICLPEDANANTGSLLRLFPTSPHGRILVLDDMALHFSSNLASHCAPSKIISTTCLSETSISDQSLSGVRILWGHHHPYQIIIEGGKSPIPWNEVKCVLWFPNFDTCENLDEQKTLLRNFFKYLAIRILADALYEVQVILTMNNMRFSQLQVMLDTK